MRESVKKIRNTIMQWFVVRWCRASIAWCFRWLCFIMQWLWERCTFNNFLIFLIFVGGGIMLAVAGILLLEAFSIQWMDLDLGDSYGLLQPLIWSIGGVGAAIGLWFANQRQKTLSEQVQAQVDQAQAQTDQSFNDRLGRGVELLANENVAIRSAGVRVLVDLFNNADEEQKPVIANIIYDFFHEKMRIRRGKNGKRLSSASAKESRQDVQNALNFLIGLPLDERKRLLLDKLIDDSDGRLNFRNLDFSGLDFTNEMINHIDFYKSRFCGVNFGRRHDDNLRTAHSMSPPKNTIRGCNFYSTKIKEATFYHTCIENTYFHGSDIDFSSVIFRLVEFWGTVHKVKNVINISQETVELYFIGMDISKTNFNFDDKSNPRKVHFQFCYYDKNHPPSPKIDIDRGYEAGAHGINVFVESDKDWSKQPVQNWVAVEMAQWKLEQIKYLPFGRRDKRIIEEAEYEVRFAKYILHENQKNHGLPEKTPKPISMTDNP